MSLVDKIRIEPANFRDALKINYDFFIKLNKYLFKNPRLAIKKAHKRQKLLLETALKRKTCLVAKTDFSNPVGYCLWDFEQGKIHLKQLYVYEGFRREGVGKKLLKEIAEKAILSAGNIIYLELEDKPIETKENAIRFYKKCGFEYKPASFNYEKDKMICKDARKILRLI